MQHEDISASDDELEGRQLSESEEIPLTDTKEAPVTGPAAKIDQPAQQILPQQGGDGSNDGHTPFGDKLPDLAQPLQKAVLPQPKIQDVTPALQPQQLVSPVETRISIGTIPEGVKLNDSSLPIQGNQIVDVTTNRQQQDLQRKVQTKVSRRTPFSL